MPSENWLTVIPGDDVAILACSNSTATEVLDIQAVQICGLAYVHLANGEMFRRVGGTSLDRDTVIVPATIEHRVAMKAKKEIAAQTVN